MILQPYTQTIKANLSVFPDSQDQSVYSHIINPLDSLAKTQEVIS